MTTAYDSTVPSEIPADAEVVLYYADGIYKWSAADLARFPNAKKGAITVTGQIGIQIIDCEPGCVWPPSTAAVLAHSAVLRGARPTIYADASNWPAVDQALSAQGIARVTHVDGWIADYDGIAAVPLGFVAKQYASHNTAPIYDTSVTNGVWPSVSHPEPPVPGLAKPACTIVNTASGNGYWIFAQDGGVFGLGDAGFYGNLVGKTLDAPIVSADVTTTEKGYRLLGADGGVFCFGDATFHGNAV